MVDVGTGLAEAVQATLEEMFFLEVMEPEFLWARVRVSEPFNGSVTLAFPRPLAEDVASGLMPGEETISEQMLQDTLAEMVNTVAGRLMSQVVDEDTTFRLEVPQTGSGWPDMDLAGAALFPYQIDRKCFMVLLQGERLTGHRG